MNRTVVHFEIPADNPEKLAGFYRQLFGWKVEKEATMDYWMIETAPEGQGVNGGMMKRQAPGQQIVNYILVESVADFSTKVTSLGGKVLMPKAPVPTMGYFAICQDPQGSVFGLWETDKNAK